MKYPRPSLQNKKRQGPCGQEFFCFINHPFPQAFAPQGPNGCIFIIGQNKSRLVKQVGSRFISCARLSFRLPQALHHGVPGDGALRPRKRSSLRPGADARRRLFLFETQCPGDPAGRDAVGRCRSDYPFKIGPCGRQAVCGSSLADSVEGSQGGKDFPPCCVHSRNWREARLAGVGILFIRPKSLFRDKL